MVTGAEVKGWAEEVMGTAMATRETGEAVTVKGAAETGTAAVEKARVEAATEQGVGGMD